jgi:hypothetical protein
MNCLLDGLVTTKDKLMRKFIGLGVLLASSIISGHAFAQSGAMETQIRCNPPTDAPVFARQVGAVPKVAKGSPVVSRKGDLAPALMVDGWKPAPGPLSMVLGELGKEAGFAVVGADGLGNVSWTRDKAPLSEVLDNLTSQVGSSWSFNAGVIKVEKTPFSSSIPASLSASSNRDVNLALVDVLRGYDASSVELSSTGISFSATPTVMTKIDTGISGISEIYAFDVSFSQGRPSAGRYNWAAISSASIIPEGAGGKIILNDGAETSLASFLNSSGDVRPGGSQTVAAPANWALLVPQSQCGQGSIELTLRPKRVGDGFSFQIAGFGAPVDVPMVTLGQTLVLAAKDPVAGWINIVSIKPRILSVK